MADIRIKDLTTTASSSASDDFIAVDGTTNGTRKLNAFSPTFGGNVVVTGTLTSSSTLSTSAGLSCQNADITGGYIILRGYGDQNGGLIFLGQSANNNYIQSNATTIGTVIANTGITDVVAAGLRVKTTTASTTTSSGALVVSGGVGIAKQIVAGEDIVIDPTDASPENLAPEAAFCRSVGLATSSSVLAFGSDARIGLLRGYQDGGNLVEWRFGSYIGSTFNEQMRLTGTSATSSSLILYGTTASTSTSSGSLVVSGGVGVAGAVNAGTFYGLVDGVTAPGTESGYARIYVDSADGDLKVKFGDGTVKTIATDS